VKRLLALLLVATTLGGCMTATRHLYPVHGPLSTNTPKPVYSIFMSGGLGSGNLSATLQNGEVCSGSWTMIRPDDPAASDMSADWDSVYGPGFFTANVLGNPAFARATLNGTQGTILNVEFNPGAPMGIAKDNRGDVFKLTF
jgi:hypothetical protein